MPHNKIVHVYVDSERTFCPTSWSHGTVISPVCHITPTITFINAEAEADNQCVTTPVCVESKFDLTTCIYNGAILHFSSRGPTITWSVKAKFGFHCGPITLAS